MIGIGIQENVKITKVAFDDKGALDISFEQGEGKVMDTLALLNSGMQDTMSGSNTSTIKLYPFNVKNWEGIVDPEYNLRQIQELRDPLTHILSNFMKADEIQWDLWKDTGITAIKELNDKVTSQEVLDKIFKNIGNQFIEQITPHLAKKELFRVVFVRQSKAKGYPAIRKRFVSSYPFMEPMTVAKEHSALGFTKWEISNGFNKGGEVVTADAVETADASDESVEDIMNG